MRQPTGATTRSTRANQTRQAQVKRKIAAEQREINRNLTQRRKLNDAIAQAEADDAASLGINSSPERGTVWHLEDSEIATMNQLYELFVRLPGNTARLRVIDWLTNRIIQENRPPEVVNFDETEDTVV